MASIIKSCIKSCFILILLILLSVISFRIYNYFTFVRFNERTQLGEEFISLIYENISTYGSIDFDIVADFEWDSLLLVTPYQNPRTIFQEEGLVWRRINTNIQHNEGITLLVFLNDRHIVHHVQYPRSMGNLACYATISFEGYIILERENTYFKVHDNVGSMFFTCLLPHEE